MAVEIAVQIGRFEFKMRAHKTKAPKAYDGFGTMTVLQSGETRYVLVMAEHETWQLLRYGSGNYLAELVDDNLQKAIEDKLLDRLRFEPKTGGDDEL